MELFVDKSCFRRLFIACALQASVQMTGVSAIQYYSVDIYELMGIEGDDTLKYQAISSCIALVAQMLCMLYIDRFGRRWTLIFGNLGNCVCFIIATIMMAKFPPGQSDNTAAAWGFIAVTWIYNFSFSATCGPLSWIIPAEIFDTKTRSKGVSMATMTSFAFNTMIGQVTKPAMTAVGYRYYFLFVVSSFLADFPYSCSSCPDLQLHQRTLLLGHPPRDLQAPSRGDELPLHPRSTVRAWNEGVRMGNHRSGAPPRRSRGQAQLLGRRDPRADLDSDPCPCYQPVTFSSTPSARWRLHMYIENSSFRQFPRKIVDCCDLKPLLAMHVRRRSIAGVLARSGRRNPAVRPQNCRLG